MKVKFFVALSSLFVLAACHHEPPAGSPPPTQPRDAKRERLALEIAKIQPGFDGRDTTLADKISGLTLELMQNVPGKNLARLKGAILFKEGSAPFKFQSSDMKARDLKDGRMFDLKFENESDLEKALSTTFAIKLRCLDTACREAAMWMISYGQEKIESAGYLFVVGHGGYQIENSSNLATTSVAEAMGRNKRKMAQREDH